MPEQLQAADIRKFQETNRYIIKEISVYPALNIYGNKNVWIVDLPFCPDTEIRQIMIPHNNFQPYLLSAWMVDDCVVPLVAVTAPGTRGHRPRPLIGQSPRFWPLIG